MALSQRSFPDGRLLAFQAVLQGQGQVAVMTPESGNWSVLTHNGGLGLVNEISWSRDGTSLYYDRTAGVTRGIFSVPVLGGEEKLVLEDALAPEVARWHPAGLQAECPAESATVSVLAGEWPAPGSGRNQP